MAGIRAGGYGGRREGRVGFSGMNPNLEVLYRGVSRTGLSGIILGWVVWGRSRVIISDRSLDCEVRGSRETRVVSRV